VVAPRPERSSVIAKPHMPVDPLATRTHGEVTPTFAHRLAPLRVVEEPSIIVIEKDDVPDGVNGGWEVLTLPGRED
jgi:hypothetical protein